MQTLLLRQHLGGGTDRIDITRGSANGTKKTRGVGFATRTTGPASPLPVFQALRVCRNSLL